MAEDGDGVEMVLEGSLSEAKEFVSVCSLGRSRGDWSSEHTKGGGPSTVRDQDGSIRLDDLGDRW